jgi:hypothetical protein
MSKYVGIIHCYFYEITGKEYKDIVAEDRNKYYSDRIPKYCISDDLKVKDFYWQQFCEDDSTIIIMDVMTGDLILQEEFNMADLTDYEMSIESLDDVVMNKLGSLIIPVPTMFKMEVEYWQDFYNGDYDSITTFEIVKKKK